MKKKIEDNVIKVLQDHPDARANDFVLYALYIKTYQPELQNVGLIYALMEAKKLKMPSYETITRIRRHVQKEDINLCPPNHVKNRRLESEREYHEKYRKVN